MRRFSGRIVGPTIVKYGAPRERADAGRVIRIEHRDGAAVLRLRLADETAGKIHVGATATVRPRSQLGDLIVELTPGRRSAPALEDGDRLDADATSATVPFSRVVATLDTDTRTWLQLLVGELDRGVGGDARAVSCSARCARSSR